ncbi:MAG: amidohydrolase family protein [Halanaerobiales bacterium]|nr:amidohydrolase family protein [Halanaerobiales bacterium]
MSIYIKNGKVVYDSSVKNLNILVEDEHIKKIDIPENFDEAEINDSKIIDAEGRYVLPGMIDAHTHYLLKSRNAVTADDFYSGSLAAAFGGVTTFIDYIDDQHDRDNTLKESMENRKDEARDAVVDYSLHQVITHFDDEIARELREIKEQGVNSIKIFTTYRKEGYLLEKENLYELFKISKQLELLPTVHAEDNEIIENNEEKYKAQDKTGIEYHPDIRTDKSEAEAVKNIGELIDIMGMPAYIAHLSSKLGLQALKQQQSEGRDLYAETTPHYLVLNREFLEREDGYLYFMTPPLRTKEDNESLWRGLTDDHVDVVATDHCAFTEAQKKIGDDSFDILPGIPGSETLLPLVHHFGSEKGLDIVDIVNKLSKNPAKIFGLYPRKGSLKEGTDADIIIFDPELTRPLDSIFMHSMAEYSPYKHIEVKGFPVTTISRGEILINEGAYRGFRGHGQFIEAEKSSLF